MIKNYFVQPVCQDFASSCLTNKDLSLAGVKAISLNLKNLLIRPGKEALIKQIDIRKFFAWQHKVILNCLSLKLSQDGKFIIKSELDGNKFILQKAELLELVQQLEVDIVVYPKNCTLNNMSPAANSEVERRTRAYAFAYEDSSAESVLQVASTVDFFQNKPNQIQILNFVDANQGLPLYLSGYFSLELVTRLQQYTNIYLENHKPATDAYNGVFYRNLQEHCILDEAWELDFSVLDENCACYTCSSEHTCAHLHHLLKNTPLLAQRLLILHNVFYINHLP